MFWMMMLLALPTTHRPKLAAEPFAPPDGDIALVLDLHGLGRQLPLRADVLDGAEVELAGVVEHQSAAAGVTVDRRLHRFEGGHIDRCLVAAAGGGGTVADRAGDGARSAGGQCERNGALKHLAGHAASPKEVDERACRLRSGSGDSDALRGGLHSSRDLKHKTIIYL